MAVTMSASLCLPNRAKLTIADLHDYPVYRWQAEVCQPLDERLASVMPADQEETQRVTSFEMMALWVAAGYGVWLSAQSRIEHALGWGIIAQPLSSEARRVGIAFVSTCCSQWSPCHLKKKT